MMRVAIRVVSVALAAVVVALVSLDARPSIALASSNGRDEIVRLQAHFDSVDKELLARQVSSLSQAQRHNRRQLITWLREYRDGRLFPVNARFPDQALPFFRDSRGVLCAMAYLIDRSGRRDIVDRVARTKNNAFIRDLADDPALVAWLDSTGLSAEEAARIQPAYGGGGVTVVEDASTEYYMATALTGTVGLGASVFNLVSPTRFSPILGVGAGVIGIVLGLPKDNVTDGRRTLGQVSLAVGATSLLVGAYRMIKPMEHELRREDARGGLLQTRFSVGPAMVPTDGKMTMGIGVSGRF